MTMGLLTSLVTQVAQSAIQSKMSQSKMGGQSQADMGGLGNIFGNVLGEGWLLFYKKLKVKIRQIDLFTRPKRKT